MDRTFPPKQATAREARILTCTDCHEEFVFTAEAQEYFADLGHFDDPKRCKACHFAHKQGIRGRLSTHIPSA